MFIPNQTLESQNLTQANFHSPKALEVKYFFTLNKVDRKTNCYMMRESIRWHEFHTTNE